MDNLYDEDVIAWAEQQAHLLRTGQWSQLDIGNIAEEIDDVGKSEKRELQSRLCVLISHLLKWSHQPSRRSHSWRGTIKEQRIAIQRDLKICPSLKPLLSNAAWLNSTYAHARTSTFVETGLPDLPTCMPWSIEMVLSQEFLPG
ncbi:DUF29 family protein [Duganella sp. CY15W]|uniref:DUF29 domain-containing protein n=1 Tax=Duganella sp. CY15W TaxID=2692172 RepID=UPI00136AE337|nr:DUF29 domain-containing protein [Duganella sp. CY15W]MYM27209.1 DUF29 family protein [Duganella sp. CY15W]